MRPTLVGISLIGAIVLAGVSPAAARPAPRLVATFDPSRVALPQPAGLPVPNGGEDRCATPATSVREAERVRVALGRWLEENPVARSGGAIRVAFHVITARGQGAVGDGQITRLIEQLNQGFAGTGFTFELASVDRTENPAWFALEPGSRVEKLARQSLAIDPAHQLNLYSCAPVEGLSGWASLPWSAPEGDLMHGIVVDHSTLPAEGATLDRTVIHEVGHYLGIPHAEAGGDEAGYAGFTPSQIERMRAAGPLYKPSLFAAPSERGAIESEIKPGEGSEPEDGRVLSYRGAVPNPFRAETALRFTLPSRTDVSLRIYSVTGRLVRTLVEATLPPGDHSAMFRAGDLPSGAYFSVLTAGSVQMHRTLVLVR